MIIVNIQQEDNSGGNYLVHAFCNDTCTFVLADTGSVHSIAYEGCYKTLLYTNPIIPFITQLRGATSKPLKFLGQNYDGTQGQLISF